MVAIPPMYLTEAPPARTGTTAARASNGMAITARRMMAEDRNLFETIHDHPEFEAILAEFEARTTQD